MLFSITKPRMAGLLKRRIWQKGGACLALVCFAHIGAPSAFSATGSTTVLALTRPLNRGDIILESDLESIEIKGGGAHRIYITDNDALIGMSVKRAIRAGVPMRAADITKPIIIAKGDMITMAFEAPGIILTTRGKSLDDGVQGATVRVMNTQTSRTVEATVTAPGYALVSMPAGSLAIAAPDALGKR